ncbi:hypothetical protein BJV77DRAFT_286297 [Russula vinacea]|nr:hypothetical protein BJV77DRAFT_286297 [Russula vinacea]
MGVKSLRPHYQHSKTAATTCQTTLAHSASTSPSSPPGKSAVSQSWHHPQGFGRFHYLPGDIIQSRPPATQEHVPASSPVLTSPDNLASNSMRELLPNDGKCMNAVGTPSFPTQEHISVSPSTHFHKLSSDHVHELSKDSRKCYNAISTPSSSLQKQVPTSQSSSFRVLTLPYKLHTTLSTWIKNMNTLTSLIDRLQELTSFVPAEHRSRLSNQVVALRVTSKRQREQFIEFLQLSEEYADKYYSTSPPRFNNKALFWTICKNAWKLQRSYVERRLVCKCCTSLEQSPLWSVFVRQFRGHFLKTKHCSARCIQC